MQYGTPTNAEQVIMLADGLMGDINRLVTSDSFCSENAKEINYKAGKFSAALAPQKYTNDFNFGMGIWEQCRVAILAFRWAAEVADTLENAYDIYSNAVELQAPSFEIWVNECEGAQPKAITKVQKELLGI